MFWHYIVFWNKKYLTGPAWTGMAVGYGDVHGGNEGENKITQGHLETMYQSLVPNYRATAPIVGAKLQGWLFCVLFMHSILKLEKLDLTTTSLLLIIKSPRYLHQDFLREFEPLPWSKIKLENLGLYLFEEHVLWCPCVGSFHVHWISTPFLFKKCIV